MEVYTLKTLKDLSQIPPDLLLQVRQEIGMDARIDNYYRAYLDFKELGKDPRGFFAKYPKRPSLAGKDMSQPWGEKGVYFGPSSIGNCRRSTFYKSKRQPKEGQFRSPESQRTMEYGEDRHLSLQQVLQHMQQTGFLAKDSRVESEVFVKSPEWRIHGLIDILLETSVQVSHQGREVRVDIRMILEIKTKKEQQYKELTEPDFSHIVQNALYAEVLDVPLIGFLYENKNTLELKYVDFCMDDLATRTLIRNKIISLHWYLKEDKLPPADDQLGTPLFYGSCKNCPYQNACRKAGTGTLDPFLTQMSMLEMQAKKDKKDKKEQKKSARVKL